MTKGQENLLVLFVIGTKVLVGVMSSEEAFLAAPVEVGTVGRVVITAIDTVRVLADDRQLATLRRERNAQRAVLFVMFGRGQTEVANIGIVLRKDLVSRRSDIRQMHIGGIFK